MNEEKTEIVVLSAPQHRHKILSTSLPVGSAVVNAVEVVRDLGAKIDQHLHMDAHVSSVCQSAFNQIHNISRV